ASNDVDAGAHTVSEDVLGGYIGTISGDCAADGTITLALAEDKECTITNDDVGGELRHWDIDEEMEAAAGNADGILDPQDDPDDATGSYHRACITDTELTYAANSTQIAWTITATPGSSADVHNPTKVAGPNGEPCYQWRSSGVGGQTITALWTQPNTTPTFTKTFYWDEDNLLPLIKQWNTMEDTSIVGVTGNVGDALLDPDGAGAQTGNTLELDNWTTPAGTDRDCSTSPADTGFCTRTNLDGTTRTVAGVLIPSIPGDAWAGKLAASGQSFIDYVFGS
ncbi:unnamed protein product, partial [marine sediment metagenome]